MSLEDFAVACVQAVFEELPMLRIRHRLSFLSV